MAVRDQQISNAVEVPFYPRILLQIPMFFQLVVEFFSNLSFILDGESGRSRHGVVKAEEK